MPARRDRKYEEALALWRSLSHEPPPPGGAEEVLQAALCLSSVAGYERFQTRWLKDPTITWAVYRDASPKHA
jgi:hypothetical protein